MSALTRIALRYRLLVVAIAAGLLVLGYAELRKAPVDVLPEFSPPYAEIQTEALGLSAEEVEHLVTVPLEADLLNGVEGVRVIRSQSLPSLSSIVLVFAPGTDVYRARQLVQERLIQSHALPRVSKPPTLLQPLSSSSRVVMVGLSSQQLDPIEQSVIARWTMRPRLMGVPGVANVAVWGMRDQQIQVQVDPEELRDRGVTLSQVVETSGNAQVVSPLSFLEASTPGSGGFIETPQQRLQVRHVLEKLADPDELGRVPVEGTRGRMRLGDISRIDVGHPPLIGDAVVDGGEGLMLVVEKFPGANTLEVTRGVEDALEALRPGLTGMTTDASVFRPAAYIEEAVGTVGLALAAGLALAVLALAGLLFQWRLVLVALCVLLVSVTAAALVLDALGETFNAILIAGLAVAVVAVLDDAISAAHSLGAQAREADARHEHPRAQELAGRALGRVRAALAYSLLIALLAIAPVAAMQGRPGAFFDPLVLAYAVASAAGLLVALTVAPALAAVLGAERAGTRESPLIAGLRPRLRRALEALMRRPAALLAAAGAAAVAALAGLVLLDSSLIPSFKDRDVLVRVEAEPGTSQPRMTQVLSRLAGELEALPGVADVGGQVGRAVTGDAVVDVNSGELWVGLADGADHERTLAAMSSLVDAAPDVQGDVASYTTQRMRDVGALVDGTGVAAGTGLSVLTGARGDLVARVYGRDLPLLEAQAERVRDVMAGVEGVTGAEVRRAVSQPNLEIEVDLERARRFGVKPGDVRRAEATLVQGIQVGSVFQDQKVFDVIVQGTPETRADVAAVRSLLIDRPGGGHVRLGQVADVRLTETPLAIEREAVSRRMDVVGGIRGRDRGEVTSDLRQRLTAVAFPLEYHVEVAEASTGEEIGAGGIAAAAVVAAMAVLLLLQAASGSWRGAAIAFALLPVALAGGVLTAVVAGFGLSLGALLGLLAVLLLSARHSVALLERIGTLRGTEPETAPRALAARAAQERLGPVLTSIAAAAALLAPAAVLGSRPGLEILHPLAVVAIGGLLTAALLALLVLPAAQVGLGGVPGAGHGAGLAGMARLRLQRGPGAIRGPANRPDEPTGAGAQPQPGRGPGRVQAAGPSLAPGAGMTRRFLRSLGAWR